MVAVDNELTSPLRDCGLGDGALGNVSNRGRSKQGEDWHVSLTYLGDFWRSSIGLALIEQKLDGRAKSDEKDKNTNDETE